MPSDQLRAHTVDLVTHQRSLDYMRWLSCLFDQGGPDLAAKAFQLRWPHAPHRDLVQKAAVLAGTSIDATWAGPLSPIEPLAQAFLAYSRPLSLLGTIRGFKTVPFNVSLPALTAPTTAQWVGEGVPKPIGKGSFATVTLATAKVADIIVLTTELVQLLAPGSEEALRQELAAAVAAFLDQQFVDPAIAAGGGNPASITNGVTPIAPSGTTGSAVVADVDKLIGQFLTNNPDTTAAVLLMTPSVASMLVSATKMPTLTIAGGTYAGLPVVVSGGVGTRIVALDAAAVLVADGGVEIDMTKHATIEMADVASNPVVAGTVTTSLWQANLVGVRAERLINWKKARATAVSLVSPTAYVPGT